MWEMHGVPPVCWEEMEDLILMAWILRSWLVFGEDRGLGDSSCPCPGSLRCSEAILKPNQKKTRKVKVSLRREKREESSLKTVQLSFLSSCMRAMLHAHQLCRPHGVCFCLVNKYG
jgi:hypothetical protein